MKLNNISEEEKYGYKSYIKDIYLELPNYRYHHSPLDGHHDENFVGRKKNEDKLLNILTDSEVNGAYLITGYRGMGKKFCKESIIKVQNRAKQ